MKFFIILIGVLIFLTFLPFRLYLRIIKKDTKEHFEVGVTFLSGIVKFKVEVPFVDVIKIKDKYFLKVKEKVEGGNKEKDIINRIQKISIKNILKKIKEPFKMRLIFTSFSNYIIKKIKVTRISWITKVGLGDAAETAIVSGIIWSIKGSIISFLLNNKKIDELYVDVTPQFNRCIIETDFYCIIKLKFVYIIIAGLNGIKAIIKGGG